MIAWISENKGTVLITLLLVLVVTGIVYTMIRDKKQGKSCCGGNCAHCKMCAGCKPTKKKNVKKREMI